MLDSNVVVAALRSRLGASRRWLAAGLRRQVVLLATPALFFEYEDALTRPEHLRATGLDAALVDEFLRGLAGVIEPVDVSFLWRPQLPDPADEMVLEAAANGRADWLITHNLRHFGAAPARFGVNLGSPGAALPYLEDALRCARPTSP